MLALLEKRIVKTFMLKLQENSEIFQIYCIRQPKKAISKLEEYLKMRFIFLAKDFNWHDSNNSWHDKLKLFVIVLSRKIIFISIKNISPLKIFF
ncbi:hypothetical protein BpHYR1_037428 [Brachionus plicatilis]|uniref:Uncharacterized protein n=1 Tax=Brachionus plicatilis TaxID=10195 RepID=A0A3M7Q258_BRAPC|nr:hypothetical protein BpHYR1_037428 [Brachionus plicatilis]